jgi:hypothetical protein
MTRDSACCGSSAEARDRVHGANSSWLNRIEAQFTALRYFTLDGTDHITHKEQGSMIRRYIIWRNRYADDQAYRRSSTGRTLPDAGLVVLR